MSDRLEAGSKHGGCELTVARLAALGALAVALQGCGGEDVTTIGQDAAEVEEAALVIEPAAEESRTVSVLARPESRAAACRLLGISAARRDPGECRRVAAACQEDVRAVLGGGTPEVPLPAGDLQELYGCPVTIADLDACLASVLERSVSRYGDDLSCEMGAPPAIDRVALFASPECVGVVLFCPQLLAGVATGAGPR